MRMCRMVKNRIQVLLAHHHVPPVVSDIFGKQRVTLSKVQHKAAAQELLRQDLYCSPSAG